MRLTYALCLFILTGCTGGSSGESGSTEIANRAQSLQRSADETTNALINQINAEAAAEKAPEANQSGKN
jgi:hypothetical protein